MEIGLNINLSAVNRHHFQDPYWPRDLPKCEIGANLRLSPVSRGQGRPPTHYLSQSASVLSMLLIIIVITIITIIIITTPS